MCRGLIPITILKRMEAICSQPIHELFDFVCGTSTGSVLAAMLCLEKLNADQCKEYYHDLSKEVFKMNNLLGISHFFRNHAFYDAKLLEKLIRYLWYVCVYGSACGRAVRYSNALLHMKG